jgi:hypothetical protein
MRRCPRSGAPRSARAHRLRPAPRSPLPAQTKLAVICCINPSRAYQVRGYDDARESEGESEGEGSPHMRKRRTRANAFASAGVGSRLRAARTLTARPRPPAPLPSPPLPSAPTQEESKTTLEFAVHANGIRMSAAVNTVKDEATQGRGPRAHRWPL